MQALADLGPPAVKLSLSEAAQAKYQQYLEHPTLSRHVKANRQGDVIQAKLCHDLLSLPYDAADIGKVPFNRMYKREKLMLTDGNNSREVVVRQSLTNPSLRVSTSTDRQIQDSIA